MLFLTTTQFDSLYVFDITDRANPIITDSIGLSSRCLMNYKQPYLFLYSNYFIDIYELTPTGIEPIAQLPTSTSLYPNYPNPFNASTTIKYELPEASEITLDIYDILGRKVHTLYDGPQTSGKHSIIFLDKELASGVYFYRLTTEENIYTQRMTLLK